MVLVFAMAAAICLRIFTFSEKRSERNEAVAEAALLAQNTAEELKASRGDFLLEWEETDGKYVLEEGYRVEVSPVETAEGLTKVELQVLERGEVLFQIPVAWQEVSHDGT